MALVDMDFMNILKRLDISIDTRVVEIPPYGSTTTETFDFQPNFLIYKSGYTESSTFTPFDATHYWLGAYFTGAAEPRVARAYANGSSSSEVAAFNSSNINLFSIDNNIVTLIGSNVAKGKGLIIAMRIPDNASEL